MIYIYIYIYAFSSFSVTMFDSSEYDLKFKLVMTVADIQATWFNVKKFDVSIRQWSYWFRFDHSN